MKAGSIRAAEICVNFLVCCACIAVIGISRPALAQDSEAQPESATEAQSPAPLAIHEVLILPPKVTLFTEPEENLLVRESAEMELIVQRNATVALKEALTKWGIPETSSLEISDRADEAALCRRDNLLEIARWRFRSAPPERLKDCAAFEGNPDAYLVTSLHGMENQRSRALGKMGKFLGYTVITLFLYPALSSYPVLSDTRRGVVVDTLLIEPGSERVILAGSVVNAGDASVDDLTSMLRRPMTCFQDYAGLSIEEVDEDFFNRKRTTKKGIRRKKTKYCRAFIPYALGAAQAEVPGN